MFYCYDCKSSFGEPYSKEDIIKDSEGKALAKTHTNLCPDCDSDNITSSTKICLTCGEYFGLEDIHCYNSDYYCEDCLDFELNKLSANDMIRIAPKEPVSVSDFIVAVLGEKLINDILANAVNERLNPISLAEKKQQYFEKDYDNIAKFITIKNNI